MVKTLKSRASLKFWIVLLIVCFPMGLIVAVGLITFQNWLNNSLGYKDLAFALVLISFPILLIIYSVHFFVKQTPSIVISMDGISINKRTISLNEIELIAVRGKGVARFLFLHYPIEAATIFLKDGSEIPIAIENYRNGHLIRMNLDAIKSYLLGENDSFEIIGNEKIYPPDYFNYHAEPAVEYRKSGFKSFNNYMFAFIIFGLLQILIRNEISSEWPIIFHIIIIPLIALLAIIQNHYFILTTNFLVVKNLFLPGWTKVFKLNNIDYAEIDNLPKQETSLKVIKKISKFTVSSLE